MAFAVVVAILFTAVSAFAGLPTSTEAPSGAVTPTFTVCTEIPPFMLHFGNSVDPPHPIVGDQVQLSFTVSGSGGIPSYTLSGAAPVFQVDTYPIQTSQLGTVTFELTAVQVGTATFTLTVNYETAFGCAERPFFNFVYETSPPFSVEVIDAAPRPTPTPSISACCGDANGDGIVSQDEVQPCLSIIPEIPPSLLCDCNHDGEVSAGELTLVFSNIANGCPGTTLPTPTPTVDPRPTPTSTPTPPPVSACIGDCNGDGTVSIDELLRGVNIALGALPIGACALFACNSNCVPGPGIIQPASVACLIRGVNNALSGCPPVPCATDLDCDDGNGCSIDRCTPEGCMNECVCL